MSFTLKGYFRCINEYNKLQITLDDQDSLRELKEKTKHLEGKSPIFTWTNDEEQERSSVSVSLPPKIANVAKRFNAIANITGRHVRVTVKVEEYDFKGKNDENVKGWRLVLDSIAPVLIEKKE